MTVEVWKWISIRKPVEGVEGGVPVEKKHGMALLDVQQAVGARQQKGLPVEMWVCEGVPVEGVEESGCGGG